jgi:exosome complex RNA-binding protein Rrp42 (RNase PH superfamily)
MSTSHSAISQRIDPVDYYRTFIKNGVRIDGRSFSDLRCVAVGGSDFTCLSECGSSLVHFGNTKVACSISVLVGTPSQLNPSSGDIGMHCLSVRQRYRRSDNNLKTYVF